MKIQIGQAIKQGLEVIIKNPAIIVMIIASAILFLIGKIIFPAPLAWVFSLFIIFFASSIICKMVYDAATNNKILFPEIANIVKGKIISIFFATLLFNLIIGIGLLLGMMIGFIFLGIFRFFLALITNIVELDILIGILRFLIAILGFSIPIFFSIFFSFKFIFYGSAILLDNEGIISSFKKSWQITKGNWWRIFGLYLFFSILMVILYEIASVIVVNLILIALIINFIAMLLGGWLVAAFTIAYIQLTTKEQQDKEEVNRVTIN